MIAEPVSPQWADDSGTQTKLSNNDPISENLFKKGLRIVVTR
jgi:hypothetical protein